MTLELHYLPMVAYLSLFQGDVVLENCENFQKQTLRNRTRILTPNGVDVLVIPVVHGQTKIPISQVRVDDGQNWRNRHWRAISSAYKKSPFFDYFEDEIRQIFYSKTDLLWQINMDALELLIKIFRLEGKIFQSKSYHKALAGDLRNFFEKEPSINFPYKQGIYKEFTPNLSSLDLLVWQGPILGRQVLASCLDELKNRINPPKETKNLTSWEF